MYRRLVSQVDDLELLLEMSAEETEGEDLSTDAVDEVERLVADVTRSIERLEEQRLFTGEFDAGDAIVSIHPGAGGTESQDWAEMLLAHVPALGAEQGLHHRAERGLRGRRGGSQERDIHGARRERLRLALRGARRPPARPHLPVRLGESPPYLLRFR